MSSSSPSAHGLNLIDGVLYKGSCGLGNDCRYVACMKARARQAQEYLTANKLFLTTDGNLVPESTTTLAEQLSKARYDLTKLDGDRTALKKHIAEMETQLKTLKTKEKAEAEAKAVYEEQRTKRAVERVLSQVTSMSPERIAQLVVEAGVEQLGPKGDSARKILSEAYATIQASYWIKSKELQIEMSVENPWTPVEGLPKYTTVKNGEGGYAVVTGVCSVGALALAKAVLEDTTPVVGFGAMAMNDRGMQIAVAALAWAVVQSGNANKITERPTETVVHWNDNSSTTREEVIEVWKLALTCPFLDMGDEDKLYSVTAQGFCTFWGEVFTSREKAQAAIDQIRAASLEQDRTTTLDLSSITDPQAKRIASSYNTAWYKEALASLQVIEHDLPAPMLATV